MIDVFSLDEVNERLEWHARQLAAYDGKDANALIQGYHLMPDERSPQWNAYMKEVKRFMIGIEAWFGHNSLVMPHSNGQVIEDAEIVDQPSPNGTT